MASGIPFSGNGEKQHKWADSKKVYTRKVLNKTSSNNKPSEEDGNLSQKQLLARLDNNNNNNNTEEVVVASDDDSSSINRRQKMVLLPNGYTRVKISLGLRSKQETRELRRKLMNELTQVRNLVKRLEAKEVQGRNNNNNNNQLSVSVMSNDAGVEKEKRTPKANQFYRSNDFLLGKEKFPPIDSNSIKKSKAKQGGSEGSSYGFGGMDKRMGQVFKSCDTLLGRLMKHKHGWVFNTPVDVKALGLHDYYIIIKNPMDLGTVKTRLSKNWYKSPREFAEDVRLTFRNAMTYNPKGQDVHIMAELLLNMFEEGWTAMQSSHNLNSWIEGGDNEFSLPTPTSKKTPVPPPFQEMRRTLDRSESTNQPDVSKPKPSNVTPTGRIPVPKKPKAKESNKRNMTYEEKQKLSVNLQSLPPEKLDNIVQIIKKRNSSLCQRDDEIEVDIDVVDVETLWELDRFVTYYKKSLSKKKKVQQSEGEAGHYVQEVNLAPAVVEAPKETKPVEEINVLSSSPVQQEKQGVHASRSSSSSSSSSDSGSSSSDSDSDSSSASDGGH
ncbi:hypothetical protein IFM89_014574 [Coptis chinensis]|uniref:Uncharacterized protein n=1 Tax=Coptis chinensis TaxID=261450 RepID=A0A835LAZ3_9MAGN|nr:hypothetical protein IFM89_014574 [Coptis chinensis]